MLAKNVKILQKISQLYRMAKSPKNFSSRKEKAVEMKLDSAKKAIERTEEFYNTKPVVFDATLFILVTMGLTFLSIELVNKYFDDLSIWLLLISRLLKYLCVIAFFSLAFASPITDKILKIKQRSNM